MEETHAKVDHFEDAANEQVGQDTALEHILGRVQKVHFLSVVLQSQVQVRNTPVVLGHCHKWFAEDLDDTDEMWVQFQWLDDRCFFQNPSDSLRIVKFPPSVILV